MSIVLNWVKVLPMVFCSGAGGIGNPAVRDTDIINPKLYTLFSECEPCELTKKSFFHQFAELA